MLGCRLVVRGILDLILKFPDLLFDTAHYCRYRYAGKILIDACPENHGEKEGMAPGTCSDSITGGGTRGRGMEDKFK